MELFKFVFKIWYTLWIIRHLQIEIDRELPDRFDDLPYRHRYLSEGMDW